MSVEISFGDLVEMENPESLYNKAGFIEGEDYRLYGLSRHVRGLLKLLGHSMENISGECPASIVRENEYVDEWENDGCQICLGFIGLMYGYDKARCPCDLLGCDEAVVQTVHKLKEGGWL